MPGTRSDRDSSGAFWREKLHAARQERAEFAEGWLNNLKAFVGDDAALMRFRSEQREDVGEFSRLWRQLPIIVWATRRRNVIGSSPGRWGGSSTRRYSRVLPPRSSG
jgi:hypothetical protein